MDGNQRLSAHDLIRLCGMPPSSTPARDYMRTQLKLSESEIDYLTKNMGETVVWNIVMVLCVSGGTFDPRVIKSRIQGGQDDQFPAHTRIRWRFPPCTLLVFRQKVVIVGLRHEMSATVVMNCFIRFVNNIYKEEGINQRVSMFHFVRSNMQAVADCGVSLNLSRLRDRMPGAIYFPTIIKLLFAHAVIPRNPQDLEDPEVRKIIGLSSSNESDQDRHMRISHRDAYSIAASTPAVELNKKTKLVTYNFGGKGKWVTTGVESSFQGFIAGAVAAAVIAKNIKECGENYKPDAVQPFQIKETKPTRKRRRGRDITDDTDDVGNFFIDK